MKVTFQGNPLTLLGKHLNIGDIAPNFKLIDNDLNEVTLNDTEGTKVFVVVPSIDTPVCDMEVKKFNEEAKNLDKVNIYAISMDLPFAQARWCGLSEIENLKLLSDYKDKDFGEAYGVYIKELGLLSRAIFIVDKYNKITYVEYCDEITDHPNYEAVLKKLKK